MAWIIVLALVALAIYGYFKGALVIRTEKSRKAHEIILNMWMDSLDDIEKKSIYGEDTTRIVRMMRHGVEQMAFDLCGYESMVNMDTRRSQNDTMIEVAVGKKAPKETMEQVRAINEKRVAEVFKDE